MGKNHPAFKPIKLKLDKWQEVSDLAQELETERGSSVSLSDAIAEAIKFFKENRPKPNQTGVSL